MFKQSGQFLLADFWLIFWPIILRILKGFKRCLKAVLSRAEPKAWSTQGQPKVDPRANQGQPRVDPRRSQGRPKAEPRPVVGQKLWPKTLAKQTGQQKLTKQFGQTNWPTNWPNKLANKNWPQKWPNKLANKTRPGPCAGRACGRPWVDLGLTAGRAWVDLGIDLESSSGWSLGRPWVDIGSLVRSCADFWVLGWPWPCTKGVLHLLSQPWADLEPTSGRRSAKQFGQIGQTIWPNKLAKQIGQTDHPSKCSNKLANFT